MTKEDGLSPKEELLIAKTNDVLAKYGSQVTLRQIYYRLIAAGVIENRQSQYQALSKALVAGRKMRKISRDALEDRTRKMKCGDSDYETPEQFFKGWHDTYKRCASLYTYPKWRDQPQRVQIWVEKQALERIFEEICDEYGVYLGVCRGYPSFTFLDQANRLIRAEGKPVHVLYFGDWDPSGLDINRHIEDEFGSFFGMRNLDFKRIALTEEIIEKHDLIPAPSKSTDARSSGFVDEHGDNCYELDAVEPDALQELIRESIKEYIDQEIWDEVDKKENDGYRKVRELMMANPITFTEEEMAQAKQERDDAEEEDEDEEEEETEE